MDVNYYLKIGQIIKELREKQNMSKTQLAKGICSVSYITRIENGERCPTSVILRQITNKLGISTEYLFRAIESPTSIQVNKLLDQIFYYYERREPNNIYKLILKEEKEICIKSIHDKQIIEFFRCLCTTLSTNNYHKGIDKLKTILDLTYIEGTTPNDIEFMLLFFYGFFLHCNNQSQEAYNHLHKMIAYIDEIKYFHTYTIIPDFYAILTEVCLDLSRLNESLTYIEEAINYCKKYNIHALLRDLYALKGELYYRLEKEAEAKVWFIKAYSLHSLIANPENKKDSEYFYKSITRRLNNVNLKLS